MRRNYVSLCVCVLVVGDLLHAISGVSHKVLNYDDNVAERWVGKVWPLSLFTSRTYRENSQVNIRASFANCCLLFSDTGCSLAGDNESQGQSFRFKVTCVN